MAFLVKADLYPAILEEELNEITRSNETLITAAIAAAIEEIRTYLFDSFDVDAIFALTGDDRHQLLVQMGADMAIYKLVARVQAGQDIEDRRLRYKAAIAWLKMVEKTDSYADLPRREDTVQDHVVYGSNEKRSNYY